MNQTEMINPGQQAPINNSSQDQAQTQPESQQSQLQTQPTQQDQTQTDSGASNSAISAPSAPSVPSTQPGTAAGGRQNAVAAAKKVAPSQPTVAQKAEDHPAVKSAGIIHMIAQTLAGGPRFKTEIDVNTGKRKYLPVPLSHKDIGMAIAMSALMGGIAGLGAKGPNATAQAAAMGFNATANARQQAEQQQEEQAQADYARHAQIAETNFRMHDNALRAGQQGFEANQAYVGQFADLYKNLQNTNPDAIKGVVSESQLNQFHVAKENAIPVGVVKRPDPTDPSKQAVDSYGIPQWDLEYAIVDPTTMLDLSDEDRAIGQKYGLKGYVNGDGKAINLPQNLQLKLGTLLNQKAKIGALKLAEHDVKDYYDTLNKHAGGANVSVWGMFPDMDHLADFITSHEGGSAGDRNVRNNNPGNLKATSPAQKQDKDGFRIFDSPEEGRAALIDQLQRDMVRMPNATPEQYFEHFSPNSAAGNGPGTSEAYAAAARKAAGVAGLDDVEQKFNAPDLVAEVKKDPLLADALVAFQAYFNRSGSYGQAIDELAKKDPHAAQRVAQLYGGRSTIETFDQMRSLDREQAAERIKANEQLRKEAQSRATKAAEDAETYRDDAKAIAGDPNDPGSGDMVALDKLISQRTKDRPLMLRLIKQYNPNWNMNDAMEKLAVWHNFSTNENGKEGDAAKQIKSFNTLFDHIGGAIDASEAYRRSNQTDLLNKPLNWWNQHAENDPMLNEFRAAIEPVRTEFMTFLQNNHALTEQDKKSGDILLSDSMTPAQLEGALKRFAETAAYRLKENDTTWQRVFRTHFPGIISADAANAIAKMTDNQGNNKIADILKDADVGGSLLGSSNGRGIPGKPLSEHLGRTQQQTKGNLAPEGTIISVNGQQQIKRNGQWVPYTSQ